MATEASSTASLPPGRPACRLSTALRGLFPKGKRDHTTGVKTLPWLPRALRIKPCSQAPGTCLPPPWGPLMSMQLPCTLSRRPPHDPTSADDVTEAGRRLCDLCRLPRRRRRHAPHQGWKPCLSMTPGSPSSRPESHPLVLLFLLFCFHCCRSGVRPPTSLCPPGFLPQPRLPAQFLQRAVAVLSSRKQPFSFCLSPAQKFSGAPQCQRV